jgi:hypothetical protein
MKTLNSVLICILSTSLLGAASTQPRGSKAAKPVAGKSADKSAEVTPTLRPFDSSLKKLPPRYAGASILAALHVFSVRPKSEFETSAEYQARFHKLPWDVYAFVVPQRFTTVEYDADTETLTVGIDAITPAIGFTEADSAGIELDRRNEHERKYLGSNAFGASIAVTEHSYDSYSLVTGQTSLPTLKLNVPRNTAPAAKQTVRVLVVTGLDSSSVIEGTYEVLKDATGFRHMKPTFDDPTEVTIYDRSLRTQVIELWMFDWATGEILGRFNPNGERIDAT